MKTLRVMDSSGDRVVEFDETEVAMTSKAHVEARELFERLTRNGAAVFAVSRGEGKSDLRVRDFNDLESENVVVPRIVGG